jgi:hypothetical protein
MQNSDGTGIEEKLKMHAVSLPPHAFDRRTIRTALAAF